jgi:hypothetical protein
MGRPKGSKNKKVPTHCKRGHALLADSVYGVRCKICKKRENKNFEKTHPEKQRKYKRKKIGWSPERVDNFLIAQGNRCAICNETFGTDRWEGPHADHTHSEPPQPRGLLCNTCNRALGMLKDKPEIMRAAADYLEKWQKENSKEEA